MNGNQREQEPLPGESVFPNAVQQMRPAARRRYWDRAIRIVVSIGGLGTIAAILLIFFYLVYEVLPLFRGANMAEGRYFPELVPGQAMLLEVDAEAGIALRIDDQGQASFFDLENGDFACRRVIDGFVRRHFDGNCRGLGGQRPVRGRLR